MVSPIACTRKFNDAECKSEIGNHIMYGRFTPFIGAGASRLRPENLSPYEWPWNRVSQTLRAISWSLDKDREREFPSAFSEFDNLRLQPPPEPGRRYLKSILTTRVALDDRVLHGILFNPEKVVEEPAHSTAAKGRRTARAKKSANADDTIRGAMITRFQAQLTRAATALSIAFGELFKGTTPSVQSPECCYVVFDFDDATCRAGRLELYRAVELAMKAKASGDLAESPFARDGGARPEVQMGKIYNKLMALAVQLSPCEEDDQLRTLQRITESFRHLAEDYRVVPKCPMLELNMLRWLEDLLWHTIRYWIPQYPTAAELAFELGLMTDGPARTPELAQAAQLRGDASLGSKEQLHAQIRSIFERCEKAKEPGADNSTRNLQEYPGRFNKAHTEFYHTIAASLLYQHELFRGQKRSQARPALALTTNYDRSLEIVFEHYGVTYHEFFPVSKFDRSVEHPGATKWYCRTVSGEAQDRESKWPDGPCLWDPQKFRFRRGYPISDPKQLLDSLEGPIILKLHGSPLIDLPDGCEHALVLSEEDYLNDIREAGRLPDIFNRELEFGKQADPYHVDAVDYREELNAGVPESVWRLAPRSVWFLGYSLVDWNIRMRLYGYAAIGSEDDQRHPLPARRRSAVDLDSDRFRKALFPSLGVDLWVGDLRKMAEIIEEKLQMSEFDASPLVKRILKREAPEGTAG